MVIPQVPVNQPQATISPSLNSRVIETTLNKPVQEQFPNRDSNYKKMIEEKEAARIAEEKRLADLKAAQDAEIARQQQVRTQQASVAPTPPKIAQNAYATSYSGLVGSIGYALASGNCVNQIPLALRALGNPISWPSTSGPYIGGAALFPYNHVGRIVGIWGNGDLEIAHENCPGCPHRYPVASFRGFR